MTRKYTILFCFFILTTSVLFAQDTPFSNMTASTLYLNPACTGVINRDVRVGSIYRSQGNKSIANPFTTYGVQADMAFYHNKDKSDFFGFGLNGFQHKEGIAGFKQTDVNLSVSYTKGISSSLSDFLTVGIQGGLSQRALNLDGLRWDSQWDGKQFNGTYQKEYFDTRNLDFYDFGAGVLYNKKVSNLIKFNTGFSAFHVFGPKISMATSPKGPEAANESAKLHRKYNFHAAAEIFTSQNATTILVPSFIYSQQLSQKNIMLGLDLKYLMGTDSKFTDYIKQTTMSFGLTYRWRDAIIPHFKMEYKEVTFYLGYDVTVSKLNTANKSFGAYEFAFLWNLKTALSNKNKPRIFKFIQ